MTFRGLFAASAAALALAAAAPAEAHVTITPSVLAAGTVGTIVFRVPSERTGVATTRLAIRWPDGFPVSSVVLHGPPGWHGTVTQRTGRISTITWTGGAIPAGTAQRFAVRAGPLPARGSRLAFRAVQTYSDGVAVRWIDVRSPGEPEPRNPAPELRIR